jgi:hypothetical protein
VAKPGFFSSGFGADVEPVVVSGAGSVLAASTGTAGGASGVAATWDAGAWDADSWDADGLAAAGGEDVVLPVVTSGDGSALRASTGAAAGAD